MKIGRWAGLLAVAAFLSGCGDFWEAPGGNTSFSLLNSGSITVPQNSSGSVTVTVTPANSFTGSVTLTCAVTTPAAGATSSTDPTCSFSTSSVSITGTTPGTSTMTVDTSSSTPTGAYDITVTGVSGSSAETTVVCVEVGTGTCSSTSSSSGNFYILSETSLAGYSIQNGTLTAISGSSFTLSGASAMAISGNYLWVAADGYITPYQISNTGALTQESQISAFTDISGVGALQVDPSGTWLLDASYSGLLYAFPITSSGTYDTSRNIQANMSLASQSVQPGGITISPSGSTNPIVAVALKTNGTQVFPFNSGDAAPIGTAYTWGASHNPTITPYGGSKAAAIAVAIDPKNRFLYIGETNAFSPSTNSGALRVYSTGSTMNEISYTGTASGSTPYAPLGTGPNSILPMASGNYLYVASNQSSGAGAIAGYSVSGSGLTALSGTDTTGTEPQGLAEDSTGSYVMAVSTSGTLFDGYSFTSSSGALGSSPVTSTTIPSAPIAIVAVP